MDFYSQKNQAHFIEPNEKSELKHWKEFFTSSVGNKMSTVNESLFTPAAKIVSNTITLTDKPLFQLHNTYIVVTISAGFLLVHQQLAHERSKRENSQAMNALLGIGLGLFTLAALSKSEG